MVFSQDAVVARKTFYAVSGFDARARMLKAVIGYVNTEPNISDYLTAIVNKAGNYTHTRNLIVHGDVLFVGWEQSKYFKQTIILNGRQPWTHDVPPEEILTKEQLEFAEDNFAKLAAIISIGLNWDGSLEKSPSRYVALIHALPNPAHSSRLDPKNAAIVPADDIKEEKVWR